VLSKQRAGWREFVEAINLITGIQHADFKGEIRARLAELVYLRSGKRKSLKSFRSISKRSTSERSAAARLKMTRANKSWNNSTSLIC